MADDPLVRLPEEVVLTRGQVARTLFALDVAETGALSLAPADAARVRDACSC